MTNWLTLLESWWSEWSAWWIGAFVSVLALFGIGGCSVVGTGPAVAQAAVEGASGGLKTMLAQYQPDEMHADVSMNVNDPTYRATVFVGVGTLCEIVLSLQGAEADIDVRSSGKGVEIPLEVKTELLSIIGNHSISEEERSTMMVEAVLGLLNPPPRNTGPSDELEETLGTDVNKESVDKPGDDVGLNTAELVEFLVMVAEEDARMSTEAAAVNDGAHTPAAFPPGDHFIKVTRGPATEELLFRDGVFVESRLVSAVVEP